jgi:hypothetical protein
MRAFVSVITSFVENTDWQDLRIGTLALFQGLARKEVSIAIYS